MADINSQRDRNFSDALLNPSAALPDRLSAPPGDQVAKRFDIYRNNVTSGLIEAMRTGFPAIQKLVGPRYFDALATEFVRAHPPSDPVILHYGQDFSAFLRQFPPLAKYPYLGDVAALEYARRCAFHAADTIPVSRENMARFPPEKIAGLRIALSPAVHFLASEYPIFSLWQFQITGAEMPAEVSGEYVLITRPMFEPALHLISRAQFGFFVALQSGRTIGQSFEEALKMDPEFALETCLSMLLQEKMASGLTSSRQENGADP